jgi:hypothetical protein
MDALADHAKVTLTEFITDCVSLFDVFNEFEGFIISHGETFAGTFPLGEALWFLLDFCNLIASKSLVFFYSKLRLISGVWCAGLAATIQLYFNFFGDILASLVYAFFFLKAQVFFFVDLHIGAHGVFLQLVLQRLPISIWRDRRRVSSWSSWRLPREIRTRKITFIFKILHVYQRLLDFRSKPLRFIWVIITYF